MVSKRLRVLVALALSAIALACSSGSDQRDQAKAAIAPAAQGNDAQPAGVANPIDQVELGSEKVTLTFWHVYTRAQEAKLKQIVEEFQRQHPNIAIDLQYQGSFGDNHKKVTAALLGGGLPDLSIAYPSMVSEYQVADKVLPLDDYINSQKYGFTKAELDDFFPSFLAESRYPEYGNKYYSFPFTKSLFVMYYNADKLNAEGLKAPETWDEFRAAAKKLSVGDAKGYAIAIEASQLHGMIFSRGGRLISDDQKTWRFHEQAGIDSLAMLQAMVKEGAAYQASKAFADQADFAQQRAFFTFGSTAGITFYESDVAANGKFQWSIAPIPHAPGVAPATVLYGASVTVFKSNPKKQLAAWLFLNYFHSPAVTGDWAPATGYLPVRKSALDQPPVKQRIAQFPAYGVALHQILPTGKAETSVVGTQETRDFIADAMVAALSDLNKSPKDALAEAAQKGQRALQR